MPRLDRAGLHGVEHLQTADNLTGREDGEAEFVVGELGDAGRDTLHGAEDHVEAACVGAGDAPAHLWHGGLRQGGGGEGRRGQGGGGQQIAAVHDAVFPG